MALSDKLREILAGIYIYIYTHVAWVIFKNILKNIKVSPLSVKTLLHY